MDSRRINEVYANMADEVMQENGCFDHLRDGDVTIIFLSSTLAKKQGDKLVLGQCEKVAEKYKWGIPADFTITVFEPNVEGFTEEQIKILLFHELLHVGYEPETERMYVKPHDLEDFKLIIDTYGTDWAKVDRPEDL